MRQSIQKVGERTSEMDGYSKEINNKLKEKINGKEEPPPFPVLNSKPKSFKIWYGEEKKQKYMEAKKELKRSSEETSSIVPPPIPVHINNEGIVVIPGLKPQKYYPNPLVQIIGWCLLFISYLIFDDSGMSEDSLYYFCFCFFTGICVLLYSSQNWINLAWMSLIVGLIKRKRKERKKKRKV